MRQGSVSVMVCGECVIGGSINRQAIDAFNEGRLDEFDDLKFRAQVAHSRCTYPSCNCQHDVGRDLIQRPKPVPQ